jgi:hypothetical protein
MKLFNIQLNGQANRSLITARQVLTAYPHRDLSVWMKTGKIGEWHGVLTQEYRAGELTVKRIQ